MAGKDQKRSSERARKRREKQARREARAERVRDEEEGQGGGLLTGLRGGMQKVAGTSPRKEKPANAKKLLDALLWIAVLAALVFYLLRRYR